MSVEILFQFRKANRHDRYAGQSDDKAVLRRVRGQAARSIDKLLAETKLHRAECRDGTFIWRKILRKTQPGLRG